MASTNNDYMLTLEGKLVSGQILTKFEANAIEKIISIIKNASFTYVPDREAVKIMTELLTAFNFIPRLKPVDDIEPETNPATAPETEPVVYDSPVVYNNPVAFESA